MFSSVPYVCPWFCLSDCLFVALSQHCSSFHLFSICWQIDRTQKILFSCITFDVDVNFISPSMSLWWSVVSVVVFCVCSDVVDHFLGFFLAVFRCLRVQMGVAAAEKLIQLFVSLFTWYTCWILFIHSRNNLIQHVGSEAVKYDCCICWLYVV